MIAAVVLLNLFYMFWAVSVFTLGVCLLFIKRGVWFFVLVGIFAIHVLPYMFVRHRAYIDPGSCQRSIHVVGVALMWLVVIYAAYFVAKIAVYLLRAKIDISKMVEISIFIVVIGIFIPGFKISPAHKFARQLVFRMYATKPDPTFLKNYDCTKKILSLLRAENHCYNRSDCIEVYFPYDAVDAYYSLGSHCGDFLINHATDIDNLDKKLEEYVNDNCPDYPEPSCESGKTYGYQINDIICKNSKCTYADTLKEPLSERHFIEKEEEPFEYKETMMEERRPPTK